MDSLTSHFYPAADGSVDLRVAQDGGKTLPVGAASWRAPHAARTNPRKQSDPKRKTPHTRVIREIRKEQASTEFAIPRGPFARLVREIAQKVSPNPDLRFQQEALDNIQEASEQYLSGILKNADSIRAINKIKTLSKMHIQFVMEKTIV